MNRIALLSAAAIALGMPSIGQADVSLGSHGTSGSRAKGIGIAVDQGIYIFNVSNASQSRNPAQRKLVHDSTGFRIDVEGGVQCKTGNGIVRAGLFIGDTNPSTYTPSGKPRERHYADSLFVPVYAMREGEGGIGFDPVAVVERALEEHVAKGGDAADFLRRDHSFTAYVKPQFKGVCRKKIGGGADTGGYWYEAATAEASVKMTVVYVGDPDIGKPERVASKAKRATPKPDRVAPRTDDPQASASGYIKIGDIKGNAAKSADGAVITYTGIEARSNADKDRAADGGFRPPQTTSAFRGDVTVESGDVNGTVEPEREPESESDSASGNGLMRGAKSLLGGLLRGKKVKDAAIDAVLGEEGQDDD